MTLTIPQYLDHFQGEEGQLRRQAISMAINRDEITEQIYSKTPHPPPRTSPPPPLRATPRTWPATTS